MGGDAGMGGACTTGCSCEGLGAICQGESCCTTLPVTGGEMLPLGPTGDERPASVDAFLLDKYEVTVGRFRRFVDAYDAYRAAGNPTAGSGAHPAIPDSGWQSDFDSSLPASAATLVSNAGLLCYADYQTWSDEPTNDALPINCVNWFVAFAFCIFDDARLPTEVEWEYASAGGSENRAYPWGNAPVPDDMDGSRAVYNCLGDGTPGMPCTFSDILPVGSKSTGASRFGQLDLSGSAWEWVLDWYAEYPATVERNYANVASGATRVYRGGSFSLDATNLLADARFSRSQSTRSFGIGFRCARNP
jgi:formylglycine-generating enzyme required for sulfatase activity